ISISFNVFIAMYAFSIYSNKEESTKFWEATFCTLMISTLIATFYGIINDTTLDRWVKGMGYARQLYGTVGTARIGMFLCTSLIYPVFYVKNRFVKIVLSLVLSILALMTLSVTTLICLIIFWMFVILFKDIGNFKKNVKTISIII